ncbi:paraneoplastic antigen Ma1 homolog [Argopecten irradians]|uniref:paraneoplastic antigen Ma1 homolog n=1 Tax=Argopecten irradians TaxID=31199 RepID=UPI003718F1E2
MNIVAAFKQMRVRPEASSVEQTVSWFRSHMTSQPGVSEADTCRKTTKKEPHSRFLVTQPPRLPIFSGDGKGDVTYDLWRYEVESLQKEEFTPEQISAAVRRSLRGEASRIAMRLGSGTAIEDLLQKMESIYGIVDKPESVLAAFYSARQGKEEDVTTWGCRLEDLISKACQTHPFPTMEQNNMLREVFWSGLKGALKDTTGYLYETIKDFDRLRVAIRRVEKDQEKRRAETAKITPAKAAIDQKCHFEELKGMINQLAGEVERLRDTKVQAPAQGHDRTNRCTEKTVRKDVDQKDEPICRRCNQPGHLRIGCKVRMDHSKHHLNAKKPSSGGR